MPWRIPSDLKTFRRLTMGKPVVMGRKTFAALGKPLPGRDNIVVTRDPAFAVEGVYVAGSLDQALAEARRIAATRNLDEVMVIGGGEIYRQALPLASRIYLTRVAASPDGDAFFPDPPPSDWHIVREEPIAIGSSDQYNCKLLVFERRTTPQLPPP